MKQQRIARCQDPAQKKLPRNWGRARVEHLAHPQFCGATFTIFKCRYSLREFFNFVGSGNACFFYQEDERFPAAFAAVLIKVISGSGAVIRDHWRSPSKQGATCGHPTN